MNRRLLLCPERDGQSPSPLPPVTEPLEVRGPLFFAGGKPFKMKSVSMFTLAQRFERGEDIRPQLDWCRSVGANCLDVFAQFCFMNWPNPKRDPFIAKLATIVDLSFLLQVQGFRVNWRVLADCQPFGDDNGTPIPALNMPHDEQNRRLAEVHAVLASADNATICIANEPPFNGVDVWKLVDELGLESRSHRAGVLFDSGDYDIIGNEAAFRVLDIFGDHPSRKPEYPAEAAKTGHFVYDGWDADDHSPGFRGFKTMNSGHVAVYTAEPMKYGEVPFDGEDTADVSVTNAEQAGGGWGVGASGACFHSVDGIRSRVPGPIQTACARAFFAAMDFSPVDAFAGHYSHDSFPDWPLEDTTAAGEVAGRIMGDGTTYAVCAQPLAGWSPVAKAGRVIQERKGDGGTLLRIK